jgi:hypothetical protein
MHLLRANRSLMGSQFSRFSLRAFTLLPLTASPKKIQKNLVTLPS